MEERHDVKISEWERNERRKILVVGKQELFTRDLIDYAVHLAERLDFDIIALNVGTLKGAEGDAFHQAQLQRDFTERARKAAGALRQKADRHGIRCEHVVKFGDLGAAVEEVNHGIKRIEFVVMPSEVTRDEVAREVTVPMFGVVSSALNEKGGKNMADHPVARKRKPVGATVGFGLATAALYAAVFMNTGTVMEYFTRGGWYSALPIGTVFLFSFVHGAFASNLWSLLGIEAVRKDALRQTEKKAVYEQKKARKRPRAYAYINPFHRM